MLDSVGWLGLLPPDVLAKLGTAEADAAFPRSKGPLAISREKAAVIHKLLKLHRPLYAAGYDLGRLSCWPPSQSAAVAPTPWTASPYTWYRLADSNPCVAPAAAGEVPAAAAA